MKTRRGWTTVRRWVAVSAAAVTLAGTASTTATADQGQGFHPGYRCTVLQTHRFVPVRRGTLVVGQHCRAFNGAAQEGAVIRGFRIEGPRGGAAYRCGAFRPSIPRSVVGFARLPEVVVGLNCRRAK